VPEKRLGRVDSRRCITGCISNGRLGYPTCTALRRDQSAAIDDEDRIGGIDSQPIDRGDGCPGPVSDVKLPVLSVP
jgi:hypothetical protein